MQIKNQTLDHVLVQIFIFFEMSILKFLRPGFNLFRKYSLFQLKASML